MRAIHVIALAPFLVAALLIIPELLDVAQYYQDFAACQQGACPDIVPSYSMTVAGISVASVGIVILLVDWIKRQPNTTTSLAEK